MTKEEAKSCIGTIELLRRLAYNIHGVMDVIDADNCKKIIKALDQEPEQGHWDYTDAYPHWVCCDKCKKRFIPNREWIKAYNIPTNYCPNCGAKMEEVSE